MPGKPAGKQGLFNDDSLMSFLQSTLETMELAAGETLSAERTKLLELQQALGGLGAVMAGGAPPPETDELVLASQLDKLEEQLASVEQQIATANNGTKQLLTAAVLSSAVVRQGDELAADGTAGSPLTGASSSAGGHGASMPAGASSGRNSHANGSSTSNMVASGLLPVMEEGDTTEEDRLDGPTGEMADES